MTLNSKINKIYFKTSESSAYVDTHICIQYLQQKKKSYLYVASFSIIFTLFFSHKDVNVVIVLDSVGEEEPAVVNVALFTMIDGLVIWLRKFLLSLHCCNIEGSAVFLTCIFLATRVKL